MLNRVKCRPLRYWHFTINTSSTILVVTTRDKDSLQRLWCVNLTARWPSRQGLQTRVRAAPFREKSAKISWILKCLLASDSITLDSVPATAERINLTASFAHPTSPNRRLSSWRGRPGRVGAEKQLAPPPPPPLGGGITVIVHCLMATNRMRDGYSLCSLTSTASCMPITLWIFASSQGLDVLGRRISWLLWLWGGDEHAEGRNDENWTSVAVQTALLPSNSNNEADGAECAMHSTWCQDEARHLWRSNFCPDEFLSISLTFEPPQAEVFTIFMPNCTVLKPNWTLFQSI